jgi:hypothetical protein
MGTAVIVGAGPVPVRWCDRRRASAAQHARARIRHDPGQHRSFVGAGDPSAVRQYRGRQQRPASQPEAIAETYWELHESRQDAERLYTAGSVS